MEGGKTFPPVLPFSQMFQRKINYHNSQSIFQPITKRVESLTVHNQFRIILITLNVCQPKSNNAIYNRGSIPLSFRESAPPVPYTWKYLKSTHWQTKLIKFHYTPSVYTHNITYKVVQFNRTKNNESGQQYRDKTCFRKTEIFSEWSTCSDQWHKKEKSKRKKNMQAKHNVLKGFLFGAQYHSKISGVPGFLGVRSFGMIRIRINDPTSPRSECIKEKEDSFISSFHAPWSAWSWEREGYWSRNASRNCSWDRYWGRTAHVHRNSPRRLWFIWLVPVPFSFLKWHLEFNSKWYTLINPLHGDDSPEHSIPFPTNPVLQTHRRPPNTSSTHRPLGWHFWGHFSLPTKEVNHDYSWDQLHKSNCYTAGNFFPPARALIGYLEVTWHLTMKLFPAKISEQCPATHECWPTTAVTARFNEFPAS